MDHKVELNGKEYVYNRPTIALELKIDPIRKKFTEIFDADDGPEKLVEDWREAAKLMLKDPEGVNDLLQLTRGEVLDCFVGFFVANRAMKNKPGNG